MFSDTLPSDISSSSDARMQRSRGAARVSFCGKSGQSRLVDLYQGSPCRVLMPRVDGRDQAEVVFINTSGGVAGGDQLDYGASVEGGATALVTTQAAEKIYGAIDLDAHVTTDLSVGAGSTLEWLPQQTIAFDKARLRRTTNINIEGDGRLLALDWLVMGRQAFGEDMTSGALRDNWRVRHDGKLVWADAFRLVGDLGAHARQQAVLGDNRAMATFVYVGPDAADHLEGARALALTSGAVAGATLVDTVLVARFVSSEGLALLQCVSNFLKGFRAQLNGLAPWPPRIWTC